LENVEVLIDGNGDLSIGSVSSIPCVASAADHDQYLAMLVRSHFRVDRTTALGRNPLSGCAKALGPSNSRRSLKSFPYGDIANATFATVILLNRKCPRPRL
jgi:hypothetical protein